MAQSRKPFAAEELSRIGLRSIQATTLTIGGEARRISVEPQELKHLPLTEVLVTARNIQQLMADICAYY